MAARKKKPSPAPKKANAKGSRSSKPQVTKRRAKPVKSTGGKTSASARGEAPKGKPKTVAPPKKRPTTSRPKPPPPKAAAKKKPGVATKPTAVDREKARRDKEREKAKLDKEREKAKLDKEREKAKLDKEREKAKLDKEREKAKLD